MRPCRAHSPLDTQNKNLESGHKVLTSLAEFTLGCTLCCTRQLGKVMSEDYEGRKWGLQEPLSWVIDSYKLGREATQLISTYNPT